MEKRKRYQMSMDEAHSHSVLMDIQGNGTSTYAKGHAHEVRSWEVLEAAGPDSDALHSHTVLRD